MPQGGGSEQEQSGMRPKESVSPRSQRGRRHRSSLMSRSACRAEGGLAVLDLGMIPPDGRDARSASEHTWNREPDGHTAGRSVAYQIADAHRKIYLSSESPTGSTWLAGRVSRSRP